MVDDTIDKATGQQLQAYCEAFFYGCNVQVVRPGDTLIEHVSEKKKVKTKIPKDFLEEHKINCRENNELT